MKSGKFILAVSAMLLGLAQGAWACFPLPPIAPSDLNATAVLSTQIDLSWVDNSDDEYQFHIERSPTGTGSWAYIGYADANQTSYSDTGRSADTVYYYRVRAYKTVAPNYSTYAGPANARTPDPTLCGTHPGNSIGLLNLLYDPADEDFFSAINPSQPGTLVSGDAHSYFAGCEFNLEAGEEIVVTHLGRYRNSSNNDFHEIRLIRREPEIELNEVTGIIPPSLTVVVSGKVKRPERYVTVARVVVDMRPAADADGFVYGALATPVRLTPSMLVRPAASGTGSINGVELQNDFDGVVTSGIKYFLVSHEFSSTDAYYQPVGNACTYDYGTGGDVFTTVTGGRFSVDGDVIDYATWTTQGSWEDYCFGPLNMKYR